MCVHKVYVYLCTGPTEVNNLEANFGNITIFDSLTRMHTLDIITTWNVPEFPNGVITSYNVTVYQTDNSSDLVSSNEAVTDLALTESVMVLPYTNYTVTVAASTSAGQGDSFSIIILSPEASKALNAHCICSYICLPIVSPPSEPGPVTDLEAFFEAPLMFNSTTREMIAVIDIVWNAPTFPNGIITSYDLVVAELDTGFVVYNNNSLLVPALFQTLTVLPYTNYTVTVAASTSAGKGENVTVITQSPEEGTYKILYNYT